MKYLILILLLNSINSSGQIIINEYSASNLNQITDNYNKTEDWIELYNSCDCTMDISGYHLSDKENKPQKWTFPSGSIMPPNSYLTIWCSGRDEISNNHYHTNFKLSQTTGKDIIILSDNNGSVIEQTNLKLTLMDHSICKKGLDTNWQICTTPSPGETNDFSIGYRRYTTTPSLDIVAGFYSDSLLIVLSNNEPTSILRYTIDGTNPNKFSPIYINPILIKKTTVIKTTSFSLDNNNILPGKMVFSTYFIDENEFTLPVISVAADDLLELAAGDKTLFPIGSIEYFDNNKNRTAKSFGELNKHGQDSWSLDQRSLDWISRDEMGYSKEIKAKLFSYSDRKKFQRVILRCSGEGNYPGHHDAAHVRDEYAQTLSLEGGMNLDQRASERIIVFLNGNYWGVYGLREKMVDSDFTKAYFNQGKYDIQYLSQWHGTKSSYGGSQALTDMKELRDFILNNNMSVPESYNYVGNQMDILSFVDFMLFNLNVVSSDWLYFNTAWWRGLNPNGSNLKWRYGLWDMDAIFDHYNDYVGLPNEKYDALLCDINIISDSGSEGQQSTIFNKLFSENSDFKKFVLQRQTDLINTVFSCDNMLVLLDKMILKIEPEMPRQIERWGGSLTQWNNNVDTLRQYITNRCNFLNDGVSMRDCYNLTGPYHITIQIEPLGIVDTMILNTINIVDFPWNGHLYGNLETKFTIDNKEGDYHFSHWKSIGSNIQFNDFTNPSTTMDIIGHDTLIAVYTPTSTINVLPSNNYGINIHPNPTKGDFVIDIELKEPVNITVDLLSISGTYHTSILDKQLLSKDLNSFRINLQNEKLEQGLYFIRLNINGQTILRKLIIQ